MYIYILYTCSIVIALMLYSLALSPQTKLGAYCVGPRESSWVASNLASERNYPLLGNSFIATFKTSPLKQGELSRGCLSIVLGNTEFRLTLYRLSDNRVLFLLPSAMMHWDVRGTELEPDFEKLFVYLVCALNRVPDTLLRSVYHQLQTEDLVECNDSMTSSHAKRTYQEFQNPMCVIMRASPMILALQ